MLSTNPSFRQGPKGKRLLSDLGAPTVSRLIRRDVPAQMLRQRLITLARLVAALETIAPEGCAAEGDLPELLRGLEPPISEPMVVWPQAGAIKKVGEPGDRYSTSEAIAAFADADPSLYDLRRAIRAPRWLQDHPGRRF